MRTVQEVMVILKECRKVRGISVPEVAEYIHKETTTKVSPKTVYGWESGVSRPDIQEFVAMCNLYMICDIQELFIEELLEIE